MDRKKNTMMMARFRHVVLRIPLSSVVFEHHSSNWQRTENINVEKTDERARSSCTLEKQRE
jgi:hypothetical protein